MDIDQCEIQFDMGSQNALVGWLLEFYVQATSKVICRLVTWHTHDDFIVLPHVETSLISHSVTLS